MSLDANRAAVVSALEAAKLAWTAYPLQIEYENRELIDLARQTDPYLMVDIVYNDSMQADMGPNPLIMDLGQILIVGGVKAGAGTDGLLKLLTHVRKFVEMKDTLGNLRTHQAKLTMYRLANGFYYQPMLVPFWETHTLV